MTFRLRSHLVAGLFALSVTTWAIPQSSSVGDDQFASGEFEEAQHTYELALGKKPDDAAVLAKVARARLFNGQEHQAIDLAGRALAVSPNDPIALSVLNTAQARLSALDPANFGMKPLGSPTTIKFVATDPLPLLGVTINGTRQAIFFIDTGAPNIIVSPQLAQELGMPVTAAGQGTFAGGRRANVSRTIVPSLRIGSVEVSNVPAGVLETRGLMQRAGVQVDGIIGTGFLMHFLSTIDYCRGELVLAPRSESARFQKQAQSTGSNIVRMWFVGDHFMFSRGRLNQGTDGLFLIDTGLAGGGITASKEALDDAGVAVDMNDVHTGIGGGGPVQVVPFRANATLGKLTRADIPGVYSPGGGPTAMFPFKVKGIMSHQFFRQSRLTFDFDAMQLVTQDCGK